MKKVFIRTGTSDESKIACLDRLVELGYNIADPIHECRQGLLNHQTVAYRCDIDGIIRWMDSKGLEGVVHSDVGYTEIFLPESAPSKRHPHYDLIVQWASDPTQKVWWSPDKSGWANVEKPTWVADYYYHIGETPPTNLEPVLFEDVCKGEVFYVAHPTSIKFYYQFMYFGEADKHLFDRKLVYSTPEGAIKRTKEMLGMVD